MLNHSRLSVIAVFASLIASSIILPKKSKAESSMYEAIVKNSETLRLGVRKPSLDDILDHIGKNLDEIKSTDLKVYMTFEIRAEANGSVSADEIAAFAGKTLSTINEASIIEFLTHLHVNGEKITHTSGPTLLNHSLSKEQHTHLIDHVRSHFTKEASRKPDFNGIATIKFNMRDGSQFTVGVNDRTEFSAGYSLTHPNGKVLIENAYQINDPQGFIDGMLRVGRALKPDHQVWAKSSKVIEPHPLF